MLNPNNLKVLLVLLLNLGAFVLVALSKIAWSDAKDVLVWSVGPLLVTHAIESAATTLSGAHIEATKLRSSGGSAPPPPPAIPVYPEEPKTKPEGKSVA
jgi:hypothetical protein